MRSVRRALLIVRLAALTLIAPLHAEGQRSAKVARIGYLSTVTVASDRVNAEAFRDGLRALGHVSGQNLVVESRHADGNLERLPALAGEIAAFKPDVIVAATTLAVRAAQRAAPNTPVVMAFAGDPVGDGLVVSLARPGGYTTGFSAAVTEIAAKRVEYLHAVAPKASRFLLLAAPGASPSMVSASERAGAALGVRVETVRIGQPDDVARVLSAESAAQVDGIIVDVALRRELAQVIELAGRRRIPTVSGAREFASLGGTLAYGANYPDLFRRAASHVDKILKGVGPSDLPVEQPTRFDLIVNVRAAKAIGVTIPSSVLTRADELIE